MSLKMIIPSLLVVSHVAWAAVPSRVKMEGILRQPLENRIESLSQKNSQSREQLEQLAFDSSQRLDTRWRAVTALGRVYPKESRPTLEKALRSPEWFMRNAALVVLPYADRSWAVNWARVLVHDPALVVRTAAVQVIRKLRATEAEALLWEKLYSSENFRGGQSLWIRRHILETLKEFNSTPGQNPVQAKAKAAQFRAVLQDKDTSLHALAKSALQKIESKNTRIY